MTRAARPRGARWARFTLVPLTLGAIAFACVPAPLSPIPGLRELEEPAHVTVPGGIVNAAGGNFFSDRVDLELDTRLGAFAIGGSYNSAGGWLWSVDVTYLSGSFRDATGARHAVGALAGGSPVPGTRWVKVDATRMRTKGGLLHEFDATTGRLLRVRFTSGAYPQLRFAQSQIGGVWRASAVEQCTSASVCTSVFSLQYDAQARLTQVSDRAGRTALFGYDGSGRLASARDALDVAKGWPGARYEYAGGFLSAITSSEGERVAIASDSAGRTTRVAQIGAGDPAWTFAYGTADASALYATTVSDPLGNATVLRIDAGRRVQSETNALGDVMAYTWTGSRVASFTEQDGTRTAWTYANDDVATETQPSANVVSFTYQPGGVNRDDPTTTPIATIVDSLGAVETRTYDAAGRLASVANGAGETTRFTYHPDESLASMQIPNGALARFDQYGEHGHAQVVSVDGVSGTIAIEYDAVGNQRTSPGPTPVSGGVQRATYDENRNLSALELRDHPASGAATVKSLAFEHGSDGRLLRVVRPYGGETRLSYDALGRVTAIAERVSPATAPASNAWSKESRSYDLLGRLTARERANGMREEIGYDAAGRAIWTRALQGGTVEADVSFSYAGGRLARARDASAGLDESYLYDTAGRLATIIYSQGESTRLAYDSRSRPLRTELALPSGAPLAAFTHAHDLADREARLTYLGTDLVARTFAAGDLQQTRYGNGLVRKQFRDISTGRASGRELWRGTTRLEKSDYARAAALGGELEQIYTEVTEATAAAGVTQEDFSYASGFATPGPDRRVSRVLSTVQGTTSDEQLSYDHLSNLTSDVRAFRSTLVNIQLETRIIYNAEHNRALTGFFGSGSQGAEFTFVHDAAGFLTQRQSRHPGGIEVATALAWNARGQIRSISSEGSLGNTRSASFAYDALGRRRERVVNGVVRRWRFGGVVEADANDQPVAIDLGEVRIAFDGQHRYRHADVRGNTKLVSNSAGQVVAQSSYSAYGPFGTLGAGDAESGFGRGVQLSMLGGDLMVIGERVYDPAFARFLSPDPVWNPINSYSYTLGNPVDFDDASGRHPGHRGGEDEHLAIEMQRNLRDAAYVALAITAGVCVGFPSPVSCGAVIITAAAFVAAQANLNLIVEQHERHYPTGRSRRGRVGGGREGRRPVERRLDHNDLGGWTDFKPERKRLTIRPAGGGGGGGGTHAQYFF